MKKLLILFFVIYLSSTPKIDVLAQSSQDQELQLKSEAAALLDTETNAVLYAKNADQRMYPASLTKIATAIYAIDKGDLDSIVQVSANAVRQDGTRVYLEEGEQVPLKKLIQGMLINSGNDAAVAIAEHIDGSVEKFSENINQYLQTVIGVKNTHFANPNGLFDENHYTTAMDLAIITNYAMKNPVFAEIFGTKELQWQGQSWQTQLYTHHLMLKGELPYPGITGGKTGYVTESKQTLATTVDNGNLKMTAVVLKSDLKKDKYDDTAMLFDYGTAHFQHASIKQGDIFKVDDKDFVPDHDLMITEEKDGAVKKVDENGLLSIENKSGQVLQQVQLTYKKPIVKKELPKKQTKESSSSSPLVYSAGGFGLILIAFIAILFGAGRKFNRNL
ncbi:D-alanyl-D-alanine carboxypeptidase family protein [Neobacillus dielmonensis]|uniref:D-alanyl-D-alanine carboxypeptidase family protein n=1 Tax=Neobacillus dielmonensis TaxID=1347369 RepID=UPI0006941E3F|nr:D-alanyl-D-alanine carboxypeptidase family protein [Neobacillus dielmonensis]